MLLFIVLTLVPPPSPLPSSPLTSPQGLQGEHDELEKAFRKEKKELEEKYAKLYGAWTVVLAWCDSVFCEF